ncbi:uncharacterized protein TNCV_1466111 [Trichonephila clavipes]|nr:uncharacterized protein TNCV_1466111 [Trichonephila clavipes]
MVRLRFIGAGQKVAKNDSTGDKRNIPAEIWVNNEENIDVPNFHCIAKFQRYNHTAGGVAVYKTKGDTTTYVNSEMDVASKY